MPYDELTYKHLNKLKQDIQGKISDNTGEASRSLTIEGNTLFGNDYIYYLANGSAPWKNPEKWRGLGFHMQESGWNKTNPYAAAFNIAHFGNAVYRGERNGLPLDNMVNDMLDELHKELPEYAKAEVLKWL